MVQASRIEKAAAHRAHVNGVKGILPFVRQLASRRARIGSLVTTFDIAKS